MDNITLRTLIVSLRDGEEDLDDRDKPSFQKISEILEKEHGVYRSRQAIQGMYNRAKKYEKQESVEERLKITDIVNLNALGYSRKDIVSIMKVWGIKSSVSEVKDILEREIELVEHAIGSCIRKIMSHSDAEYFQINPEVISHYITYKNIPPVESKVIEYIAWAFANDIEEEVMGMVREAYQITGSRDVARHIIMNLKEIAEGLDPERDIR